MARPEVRESILRLLEVCPRSERGVCGLYALTGAVTGAGPAEVDAALDELRREGHVERQRDMWRAPPAPRNGGGGGGRGPLRRPRAGPPPPRAAGPPPPP